MYMEVKTKENGMPQPNPKQSPAGPGKQCGATARGSVCWGGSRLREGVGLAMQPSPSPVQGRGRPARQSQGGEIPQGWITVA